MDLDSSSSSGDLSSYLESRVSGLVFSGHYGERVWNEAASGFRDRVCVDDSEADAVKALRGVARRAKRMRIKLAVLESKMFTIPKFWYLIDKIQVDMSRIARQKPRRRGRSCWTSALTPLDLSAATGST